MSIANDVKELKDIDIEIKRYNKIIYDLKTRKKILEKNITEFLEERDEPGLKYNGIAILKKEGETRKRKNKNEKIVDGMGVLQKYGVNDPEKIVTEIIEAIRGDPSKMTKLHMEKIKN